MPNIAVVVATLGRPDIVTATVKHLLETQILKPATVVVSCVVRGFGNLSFPQPEGGIVTVVYPIIFNPGEASGATGMRFSKNFAASPKR